MTKAGLFQHAPYLHRATRAARHDQRLILLNARKDKKRARPGKIGLSDEGLDAAARRLRSLRGAQLLGVLSISVASPLGKGSEASSPLSLLNSKCR